MVEIEEISRCNLNRLFVMIKAEFTKNVVGTGALMTLFSQRMRIA
jgi:hypothetical protein